MPAFSSPPNLGRLVSTHGVAPAYTQRAAIVAALSLVFFLAMMLTFYLRQKLGYFLLASGFLVIYLLTMFGWLMLRRGALRIYENGLVYRQFAARWSEIEAVAIERRGRRVSCEIRKASGEKIVLADALENVERLALVIRTKAGKKP